jgi:hypothetical protein
MVLTKKIENKWCPSNKKHFELLGYEFTHMRDAFLVNFEDMSHNSDKFIDIKCDYCGDIFQKQIKKYYDSRKIIQKDCCYNCRKQKSYDARMKKYGTVSAYVNGYTIEKHKEKYKNDIGFKIFKQIKEIFEQRNYTLISTEYVNNHTPIEYICNKHSQYGIQKITWMHLRNGEGCYYCGKESCKEKLRYSIDYVKNLIELNGKNKLLSSNYTSYNDYNLLISCEECGNPFVTSLSWFRRGKTKCNDCNCSIGEKNIMEYLKSNNYIYEHDCHEIYTEYWINPLRFDFYIPIKNLAIEFDGEQHFKPVDFNNEGTTIAYENFLEYQKRDMAKNKYCIDTNIILIRIPYWERDNIENILDNYFNNNDLTYVINYKESLANDSLLLCSNE